MKKSIFLLTILLLTFKLQSQIKIDQKMNPKSFALVKDAKATAIYCDKDDFKVVGKTANLLASDIMKVTGLQPQIISDIKGQYGTLVIMGTIGKSKVIDQLIKDKKLDVAPILNGWEQYSIQVLEKPTKGVARALVIVGSDHRGTAFGALSVSEAIGVSLWSWWADVPVIKSKQLFIQPLTFYSKTPTIKYRGIFLNDEDWGLRTWAKVFEPEVGNIGPKTYAKIFELMLRLKGNMVAPAMHQFTASFYSIPENKKVADEYGIIITTSHAEPLHYNNAEEWDKKTMGEWNYLTNKAGILGELEKRVAETAPYDNIYTIALRGIHDAGMVGVAKDDQVKVLERAVDDERDLLTKHLQKPIDKIAQIFVPYKEVLELYEQNMKLPEDITIVWPDDNFGYIKKLSDNVERKRSSGSGVYYHLSYLGEPHDYLWLNTTPPALMFEELNKAYNTGADRYWLLNVGDIKPGELGIQTFMEMAWDLKKFNLQNINNHQSEFLASIFGNQYKADLQDVLDSYYTLAFQRKPEFMGWGWEWNSAFLKNHEQIFDTDFSFTNYNEAENRIKEYERITAKATKIYNGLPNDFKPAFYELVYYPVKGATLMNKKMLGAQQNRWYARQGRALTNKLAEDVKQYQDSIAVITKEYNSLLNGKWDQMMALAPGWTATYQDMPPVSTIKLPSKPDFGLMISNQDMDFGTSNVNALPSFNPFLKKEYFIEIYNKSSKPMDWKASTEDKWIKLSKTSGKTTAQERIYVTVNWNKAPAGTKTLGEIKITSDTKTEKVFASLFNPATPMVADLKNYFVEDNGVVSINPADFSRKNDTKEIKLEVIDGLGYEGKAVILGDATAHEVDTRALNGPKFEYDFYTFNAGSATVYTYALPIFALDKKSDTRYGVMVDDGLLHLPTTASKEYSGDWKQNVIRNSIINASQVTIDKPGKHTLKIFCSSPGMVIQKIVIDMGGMKRSYLGPETTKVK